MIAFTYRLGLEKVWVFVHLRGSALRRTRRHRACLVSSALVTSWMVRPIVALAELITILFHGIYAAAQLKTGAMAFHALFKLGTCGSVP